MIFFIKNLKKILYKSHFVSRKLELKKFRVIKLRAVVVGSFFLSLISIWVQLLLYKLKHQKAEHRVTY